MPHVISISRSTIKPNTLLGLVVKLLKHFVTVTKRYPLGSLHILIELTALNPSQIT